MLVVNSEDGGDIGFLTFTEDEICAMLQAEQGAFDIAFLSLDAIKIINFYRYFSGARICTIHGGRFGITENELHTS